MDKLYIDDIRDAPEGWNQCRTVTEAIKAIRMFRHSIKEISIDHDISYQIELNGISRPYPSPETFMAVLLYIIEVMPRETKITLHTANPVGRNQMMYELTKAEFFNTEVVESKPCNRLEESNENINR